MANSNDVFFPVTRLIAGGKTPDYGPNVIWLDDNLKHGVVPGSVVTTHSLDMVIALLQSPVGVRIPSS